MNAHESMGPTEPLPGAPSTLDILWQDEDLIAVHKPAGWLVHRTGLDGRETRFVLQTLRDQLGGQHVYPVHRLDKGTSGVLLMALHPQAARAVSLAFEAQLVEKHYIAMVRGWPAEAKWQVDHALKPDDAAKDAEPQAARTTFRKLATLQLDVPVDRYPTTRAALVAASPHTGRRHQIRRHLKHGAHPIIGDATHGKGPHNRWWAQHLGLQRLWLHAWSLALQHPRTGQWLRLESALQAQANDDWHRLIAGLPWHLEAPAGAIDLAIAGLRASGGYPHHP